VAAGDAASGDEGGRLAFAAKKAAEAGFHDIAKDRLELIRGGEGTFDAAVWGEAIHDLREELGHEREDRIGAETDACGEGLEGIAAHDVLEVGGMDGAIFAGGDPGSEDVLEAGGGEAIAHAGEASGFAEEVFEEGGGLAAEGLFGEGVEEAHGVF